MTAIAIALLGFGVSDLFRWSPQSVSGLRAVVAVIAGAAASSLAAVVFGWETDAVVVVLTLSFVVLGLWQGTGVEWKRSPAPGSSVAGSVRMPAWAAGLALVATVFGGLLALSGSFPGVGQGFQRWHDELGFQTASAGSQQFAVVVGGFLFLTSTANRIVRFVLEAADASAVSNEKTLPGGRLLGPMERLAVAALLLAGETGGAGFVIAAKGLVRLPEIRKPAAAPSGGEEAPRIDEGAGKPDPGQDHVAEYFLIGTFASLLLSAAVAGLISASG